MPGCALQSPTSRAARVPDAGAGARPVPAADPMTAELQRAIEAPQRDDASLLAQLAQAKSEADAFAIQTQIQQRQVGLQVDVLRIQAACARRAGRDRLAWQLDRTIDARITPDAPRPQHDERGMR